MTAPSPILSVDRLTKTFGGLSVVRELSFDVWKNSRTAIIGPNGAGKTMLFNLLTGIYPPSSGTVLLDGTDITSMPERGRIREGLARTFQNVRMMQELTVLENLLIGQHHRIHRISELLRPVRMRRKDPWVVEAIEALHLAGLEQHAWSVVAGLPYGTRKQVELVRAVLAKPKLLLLDEPAAGLNPAERVDLKRHLEKISQQGITLLVVEHDMEFIGDLCGHVVALNFGTKIAEGSLDEVRRSPEVQTAYLGLEAGSVE